MGYAYSMMQTMNTQPQPFDAPEDGLLSGWTDEEIDAYARWCEEEASRADALTGFSIGDPGEPPF
jgi:hypothetical protein